MLNGATKNGTATNNGVHKVAAMVSEHDLLWDGLTPTVTRALAAALGPHPGLTAQGPRRAYLLLH